MMNKQRCFISLELPKKTKKYIIDIQKKLEKEDLFFGKFTEPENLHLTLKFLSEIDDGKIEKVKEKLKGISFPCFDVEIDEVGVFSEKYVRIIWLKLSGDEVFELQKKIDEVLSDLFEPEHKFMSHVTIARIKKCDKKKLLKFIKNMKIKKINFNVDKFYLKESKLSAKGPEYNVVEEFDLIKKKYS